MVQCCLSGCPVGWGWMSGYVVEAHVLGLIPTIGWMP